MVKMKEYEKMTRKELAILLVEDQIKRNVVKEENKLTHVKRVLKGFGSYIKPMSKTELVNYANMYL